MSSQEEGAKALAGPDLSKPQGENKFSLLPVCWTFFYFFKKLRLMSNMQTYVWHSCMDLADVLCWLNARKCAFKEAL